ncbi:hypothetical protein OG345_21810 [Streptomyces sp. NBC_01220]|uniref:hypothetical protein n=1 Tax=Streptomyces sp. NBC_01220 TaxID=2903781 RepID=UPI00352C823F|nr:hypothetical protein OG345_21810 [Streptomyces sp. NBC_01220]
MDGNRSPELLQRPRQVIIAADFPKQVTHSVVWLSEMSLDIDLIQVGLWKVEVAQDIEGIAAGRAAWNKSLSRYEINSRTYGI